MTLLTEPWRYWLSRDAIDWAVMLLTEPWRYWLSREIFDWVAEDIHVGMFEGAQ